MAEICVHIYIYTYIRIILYVIYIKFLDLVVFGAISWEFCWSSLGSFCDS